MKKLIPLLVMLSSSSFADGNLTISECKKVGKYSEIVMTSRVSNFDMEAVVSESLKYNTSKNELKVKMAIINDAYSYPIIEEYKLEEVEYFKSKWYNACIKTIIGVDK